MPQIVEVDGRRKPIPREDPTSLPAPAQVRSEFEVSHGTSKFYARGTTALFLAGCVFFGGSAGGACYLLGRYVAPLSGPEQVLAARFTELEKHTVASDAKVAQLEVQQTDLLNKLRAEHVASERNTALIAGALRRAGVKLEWEDGTPIPVVEVHPAPLRVGKAPPIQPVGALARAPSP